MDIQSCSRGEGGDLPSTRRSVIAFATAAAVNSSPLPLPRCRCCCEPVIAVVNPPPPPLCTCSIHRPRGVLAAYEMGARAKVWALDVTHSWE